MRASEAMATDWESLIGRYERRVIVALLGAGVPIERAREIAQETWTKLMSKEARGELREVTLPGLAITQALFLARDEQRRARRRPQVALSEALLDGGVNA